MLSEAKFRSLKEQKGVITGFDATNKGNIFIDGILRYVQEKDRFKAHSYKVGQRVRFTQHKGDIYSIEADNDPVEPGAQPSAGLQPPVESPKSKASGQELTGKAGAGASPIPPPQGQVGRNPEPTIVVGAYDPEKITGITMGCSIDVGKFSNVVHSVTGTDPEHVRRCLVSELAKRASLNEPTRVMIQEYLQRTYLEKGELR